MAAPKQKAEKKIEIAPIEIHTEFLDFLILGKTPLICNSPSFKAMTALLKPSGRMTTAEKETKLKHIPMEEFVNSTIRRKPDEVGPTRLLGPTRWFKGAVSDVATRIPGVTKTAMEQLVWAETDTFDLYGVPEILMSWVRNSDINRTPDVRTRAILRKWCCTVRLHYVKPHISSDTLCKLMGSAGILNGVGDFRQQKGAGNYGQFAFVNRDDRQFNWIVENGGLEAQDAALEAPLCYDQVTQDLLNWFNDQMKSRDDNPHEGVNFAKAPDTGNTAEVAEAGAALREHFSEAAE